MATRSRIFAIRARVFANEQEALIDPADAGGGVSTLATLTKTFANNESTSITLSEAVSLVPTISAYKEIPQEGITSKGNWDVDTTASNYEQYNEAEVGSYSNKSITPSNATGDGTFSGGLYNAYDVENASYDSKSLPVGVSFARGLCFNNDGTKVYAVDQQGSIKQYSLSTPYDISTYTYDNISYGTGVTPFDVQFNNDGTKIFFSSYTSSGYRIYERTVATPYDLSSTITNVDYLNFFNTNIRGFSFTEDGTKLYVCTVSNDRVAQYNLTTPFDVSTATYVNYLDASSEDTGPEGVFIRNDGSQLFVSGITNDYVYVYDMSTAYDISTATYSNTSFYIGGQEGNASGLEFNPDGSKMYIVGTGSDTIYQYSTGTADVFNSSDVGKRVVGNSGEAIITSTDGSYSLVSNFASTNAIAAGDWSLFGTKAESDGSGLTVNSFNVVSGGDLTTNVTYVSRYDTTTGANDAAWSVDFSPDGTKMYVVSYGGASITQYTLTTAWDVTTATFVAEITSGVSDEAGFRIKDDGTRIWICDYSGDYIEQADLSTPWDLTTRGSIINKYFNNAPYGGTESSTNHNPFDIAWNADGSRFFTICWDNAPYHLIQCYSVASNYDISSPTYVNSFDFSAEGFDPQCFDFNSDGTKLFIARNASIVYQYNLSTGFDLSTASYSGTNLDFDTLTSGATTNSNYGFRIKDNDTKFFMVQDSGVSRYSTGTSTTTYPSSQYLPAVTAASGQIDSSSWTDLNSMVADETKGDGDVFYAVSTDNRTTWNVISNSDGVRPIARNNANTWQYNSSASYGTDIWTNSTSNDEHQALQQALSSQAVNRMDKAQLQAVTDPNHFTLGDTLDLMIAPYVANGTSLPISDGVTIGYDASALQRLATPGVDYQADVANTTTVNITSLAAQNLKVRIL